MKTFCVFVAVMFFSGCAHPITFNWRNFLYQEKPTFSEMGRADLLKFCDYSFDQIQDLNKQIDHLNKAKVDLEVENRVIKKTRLRTCLLSFSAGLIVGCGGVLYGRFVK
jgi:hypothetical protein